MIRRDFLIVSSLILVGCHKPNPVPPNPAPPVPPINPPVPPAPSPVPPAPPSSVVQELLDAHNKVRSEHGLGLLRLNYSLENAAQSHASYMHKVGQMAHEGIGDGTPWTRINASGYRFSSAAENVAMDGQGVAAVMNLWVNSEGHLRDILGPYQDVGLAVSGDFWCVDFGTAMKAQDILKKPKISSTHISISE